NDDPHRPFWIGLRPRDTRHRRQRGSARCQAQKTSAGKFHFEPPFPTFHHLVGAHGGPGHVFPRPPGTKGFHHRPHPSPKGVHGGSQAAPIPWALERLKSFIRSIRPSLNRRFGGGLSTGFTRATSICGKTAVVALVVPIVADSCACAASDHAAAMPPNRLM